MQYSGKLAQHYSSPRYPSIPWTQQEQNNRRNILWPQLWAITLPDTSAYSLSYAFPV